MWREWENGNKLKEEQKDGEGKSMLQFGDSTRLQEQTLGCRELMTEVKLWHKKPNR